MKGTLTLTKGDKITVKGNSIFELMGFGEVQGEVFTVYPDGHGIAFKCKQTGAIETADFGDGTITKL